MTDTPSATTIEEIVNECRPNAQVVIVHAPLLVRDMLRVAYARGAADARAKIEAEREGE